jgi:hypothetical protein
VLTARAGAQSPWVAELQAIWTRYHEDPSRLFAIRDGLEEAIKKKRDPRGPEGTGGGARRAVAAKPRRLDPQGCEGGPSAPGLDQGQVLTPLLQTFLRRYAEGEAASLAPFVAGL